MHNEKAQYDNWRVAVRNQRFCIFPVAIWFLNLQQSFLILHSNRAQTILHPSIGKIKLVWGLKCKGKDLSSKNSSEWIVRCAGCIYVTVVSRHKTKRTGSCVSSRDCCMSLSAMILSCCYNWHFPFILCFLLPSEYLFTAFSLSCPTHIHIFASPSCFPKLPGTSPSLFNSFLTFSSLESWGVCLKTSVSENMYKENLFVKTQRNTY